MNVYHKLRRHLHHLSTTSAAARLLFDFSEDYGENKNLDIKVSFSKSKFLEEFPETKPSSITFDKNGIFKI
jgi:hypothetical protein